MRRQPRPRSAREESVYNMVPPNRVAVHDSESPALAQIKAIYAEHQPSKLADVPRLVVRPLQSELCVLFAGTGVVMCARALWRATQAKYGEEKFLKMVSEKYLTASSPRILGGGRCLATPPVPPARACTGAGTADAAGRMARRPAQLTTTSAHACRRKPSQSTPAGRSASVHGPDRASVRAAEGRSKATGGGTPRGGASPRRAADPKTFEPATVSITVPPGAAPGQRLCIDVQVGEKTLTIYPTVPKDVPPGQRFSAPLKPLKPDLCSIGGGPSPLTPDSRARTLGLAEC